MDIQTHKLFVLVTDEKFSLSERINASFYLQRRIRNLLKLKFDKNTNEFDYTIESILNDQWDIEKDLLNKIKDIKSGTQNICVSFIVGNNFI